MSLNTRSIFQAHPFHLVSPSLKPLLSSASVLLITAIGITPMDGLSQEKLIFLTNLFSEIHSISLSLGDNVSEYLLALTAMAFNLLNSIAKFLGYLYINVNTLLFYHILAVFLNILLIYARREWIKNFIDKIVFFLFHIIKNILYFIFSRPIESLNILLLLLMILNAIISIVYIGPLIFSYTLYIINNMDTVTAYQYISDYNCLISQDTMFTSRISLDLHIILKNLIVSGYFLDNNIFSDYLLMDGNIGGGSSSASNMANSNFSGLPNLPGGGSSSGGQANLTDFDRYITSFGFGDAPKAGQLLPYLFGEEASNSIKQLVALRAISVAEDNPWINGIELTNIENKYNSVYRKAFWLYQQEHKLGSFPPVNNDLMMTDLKQLVLLSSCVDNLRLSYGLSPLLGDSYPMERATIPYSSQVASIMKLIRTEMYENSNALSQSIERTLPADSQNRIMMSIEGRLPRYISYEEKISVSIEWLTCGMPHVTDVDIYDKWSVDTFRARTGLNTSVELPPRAARLASIDHYNKKIFTGDSSYLDNQLRTKAYMINNSPILRELYRGQDVFR